MLPTDFYLSLAPTFLSLCASAFFFVWWCRDRFQTSLLSIYALAFMLMYLFKIPNVMLHAGISFTQERLYPFLFFGMAAYFVAHLLFLRSIAMFRREQHTKLMGQGHLVLFWIAIAYFYFAFFVKGSDVVFTPVWASNILFFIPLQCLLLYTLWQLRYHPISIIPARKAIGLSAFGTMALIVSSILYIGVQITASPRYLWYLAAVSSTSVSSIQAIAVIFLFLGSYMLAMSYRRSTKDLFMV